MAVFVCLFFRNLESRKTQAKLIQCPDRKVSHCIGRKASQHLCMLLAPAQFGEQVMIPATAQGFAALGNLGDGCLGREPEFSLLGCFPCSCFRPPCSQMAVAEPHIHPLSFVSSAARQWKFNPKKVLTLSISFDSVIKLSLNQSPWSERRCSDNDLKPGCSTTEIRDENPLN